VGLGQEKGGGSNTGPCPLHRIGEHHGGQRGKLGIRNEKSAVIEGFRRESRESVGKCYKRTCGREKKFGAIVVDVSCEYLGRTPREKAS